MKHDAADTMFGLAIILTGIALAIAVYWISVLIADAYIKLRNWLYMNSKHLTIILSALLLTSCAYVTKYECLDNDPFGDSQLDDPEYDHDKFLERNNFKRQLPNTKFA